MNRIAYTPEDFAWTQWDGSAMENAITAAVSEARGLRDQIVALPHETRNFENTFVAVDRMYIPLYRVSSRISFLMNVSPKQEVRDAAQPLVDKLEAIALELAFDEDVYEACKAASEVREDLPADAVAFRNKVMRSYHRSGFGTSAAVRAQLQENTKQILFLCNEFQKHLNDDMKHITVAPADTVGLSEVFKAGLKKDEDGNFIVTTKYPDYFPFIEQAERADKRKELVDAFFSLGGDENIAVLKQILELRQKNAKLLGYENHAAYVLEERMSKTVDTVMKFLQGLAHDLQPLLVRDMEAITQLKHQHTNSSEPVHYYDVLFYRRMLAEAKYNVDSEVVRQYFPLQHVLDEMRKLYSELFSVSFERVDDFPVWHEDVQVYRVMDTDGKLLSYFCLDLHPREGKYGHAAEFPLVVGYQLPEGDYVAPVAAMVANFPKGTPETPSLMPHDQVETLFHEFGHVMHENLSQQRLHDQSGTNVTRDFVEAPSQMLENWVWDTGMLKRISAHYQTGESLPDDVIEKMLAAKNNLSGYVYMRQLVLGLFDMRLHTEDHNHRIVDLYNEIVDELLGISMLPEHRYPSGFAHLVNGYDAGYYGYLWSNVYAADMFSRFAEEGVTNKKLGMEYRRKILEVGGSRDEMESLVDFLGRQPNNKAFLKEIGL